MRGNTVTIEMPMQRGKVGKTIPLYQYDYGQKLIITGIDLPTYYEVHFSNELHGEAVTSIGDSTGVDIPDDVLTTGQPIYLWLFLHETGSDGETEFQGAIPVIKRAGISDVEPTPAQQTVIEQAIAALNAGVTEVEEAVEGIEDTIEAALTEAKESGEFDGVSPTVEMTPIENGYQLSITDASGTSTASIMNGEDGSPGTPGADGFSPTASVSKSGSVATISITDKVGTTTVQVNDGETGPTPEFSIGTVTTGEPGTDASATITGTAEFPELNLTIPQGADGDATVDDTAGDGDTTHVWSADKLVDEFGGKTDKVASAVSGNFAGLDSNGNLVDSGHKHSDYLTEHQDLSGKADKVANASNGHFASLDSNGNLVDSGHKPSDYITSHQDISGKADKVSSATNGNLAGLDSNGNLKDSGIKSSDVALIDDTSTANNRVWSSQKTNELKSAITNTDKALGTKQVGTTTAGAYLNANGALMTSGVGTAFVVKTYPVIAGNTYILNGDDCRIAAALPLAVWSLTAADNDPNNREILIDDTNAQTLTDYNVTYTPNTSGYILIASHTSYNEVLLYINATDESMLKNELVAIINNVSANATETKTKLNGFESDNFVLSPNLFNKATVVNGYVSTSTGNIVNDSAWRTSDYIPVDVTKTYYCQAGGTYAFYGASKNFLGYDSVNPIVPIANTKYLRKSVKATNLDVVMLYELPLTFPNEDTYYPYGYMGLKDNMIRKNVSQLVIQTFGDSMVGMGKWQESCRFRLGLKKYINSGHSGYKMSQTGDLGSTPIDTIIENELDNTANIVTIWGGTNDFYGNATIGNPSDNVNTTFYGALNLATKYLCENKPNVKIMFITPLNRFDDLSARFPNQDADGNYINEQGKILEDYVNAMIDVCKRNSIKCLDFYHDGGINKWNESSLMSDGIHPTNDYFAVLGKRIAEELNLLI